MSVNLKPASSSDPSSINKLETILTKFTSQIINIEAIIHLCSEMSLQSIKRLVHTEMTL